MDVSGILKGEAPGSWYTIPTNDEENEPRVLIRSPSPKLLRDLGKKHGLARLGKVREGDLNNQAFQAELVDHMILKWENIAVADGEDLPCTSENKAALCDHWYELHTLVLGILTTQRSDAAELLEQDRGN